MGTEVDIIPTPKPAIMFVAAPEGINSFNKNCLIGIKANKKRINELLNNSLMLVTPLTKIIGYDLASKVALNAYNKDISLKESCLELTDLSESEFDKLTNPKNMV